MDLTGFHNNPIKFTFIHFCNNYHVIDVLHHILGVELFWKSKLFLQIYFDIFILTASQSNVVLVHVQKKCSV